MRPVTTRGLAGGGVRRGGGSPALAGSAATERRGDRAEAVRPCPEAAGWVVGFALSRHPQIPGPMRKDKNRKTATGWPAHSGSGSKLANGAGGVRLRAFRIDGERARRCRPLPSPARILHASARRRATEGRKAGSTMRPCPRRLRSRSVRITARHASRRRSDALRCEEPVSLDRLRALRPARPLSRRATHRGRMATKPCRRFSTSRPAARSKAGRASPIAARRVTCSSPKREQNFDLQAIRIGIRIRARYSRGRR